MLQNFTELIQNIENLEDREAPETNPYKYRYEARELISKSIGLWKNAIDSKKQKLPNTLEDELNILKFYLGQNYNETEERNQGSPYLEDVVRYLTTAKEKRLEMRYYLIRSLNLLGIMWADRGDVSAGKKYLDQAEQLYTEYMEYKSKNNDSKEKEKEEKGSKFELEYTQTLYYFAQLWNTIGNREKSAWYCFRTLERQLREDVLEQLNRRQWTKNAIELSNYFTEHHKYRQAIHCLEASCAVAPQFDKEDEEDMQLEADIAKTWGTLYFEMLKQSCEVMIKLENEEKPKEKEKMNDKDKDQKNEQKSEQKTEQQNNNNDTGVEEWIESPKKLMLLDKNLQIDNTIVPFENLSRFLSLKNNIDQKKKKISTPTNIPSLSSSSSSSSTTITPTPPEMSLASTFEEAKELFLPGLKHLSSALNHYILDGYVTDHVKITQTMSQMYEYLAYFERSSSNKCKMHKRRINLLTAIEQQLSPQVYLEIVQELDYEIAQVYRLMANLKLDALSSKKKKSVNDEKKYIKINELFNKSIQYLNKFIELYEFPPINTNNSSKPEPRSPEKAKIKDPHDRCQYLLAYFHLAAIYGKLRYSDKTKQLECLGKSIQGYEFVVKYYQQNQPIPGFQEQFEISKQMKDLLPLKLTSL